MPTAISVDYPPEDVDCNVLNADYPNAVGSFGDDLISRCTVPPGWYPEVVSQPSRGVVAFDQGGQTWQFAVSSPQSATVVDTFTYRLTDGTDASNVATVTVTLAVDR